MTQSVEVVVIYSHQVCHNFKLVAQKLRQVRVLIEGSID